MNSVRRQSGFTLIELMVAMTIFLGTSIVIFNMLANSEAQKRATTTVDDAYQNGTFSMLQLGMWIRSAGSGFAQDATQAYGCTLNEITTSATVLPKPAAFAAPFANIPQTLTLAPLIIFKNQSKAGSDVIAVMEGNAGFEQTSNNFLSAPTSTQLNLSQGVNIAKNDLMLVTDQPGASQAGCLIEQVSNSYATGTANVALGGTYATAGPSGTLLSGFSANGAAVDLGSTSNPPNFLLLGVGDNNVLYSYDLLQVTGITAPTPVADDVMEMHALYWVNTDTTDGNADTWEDPGTSPWSYASLNGGTAAAASNLKHIKGIRLGLILRSDLAERDLIAEPGTVSLFADLADSSGSSLKYTSGALDKHYHYRTIEATILLRNNYLN